MAQQGSGSRLSELRIDREVEESGGAWGRRLVLLALAVVLALLAWWWFLGRDRALPVELATVTARVVGEGAGGGGVSVLDASGYVTARRQATVSSKITGKVVEVRVEEGQAVEEGQILARLDDSLARRQLALAEAELTSARSSLREIEVRLAQAERDLERARNLAWDGVVSTSVLDDAQAERDAVEARLDVARDQVAVAESSVALRRQELEDTRIRAPFSGVAISKDAQPGEMISPVSAGGGFTRTGVSTIVDMDSLEIEVDVNEAYIDRVRDDQRVVATLDAYPDWRIPAHVITTIPAADRQKATVLVRIGFDELGDPRILPDMGVKVSFKDEPETDDSAATSADTAPRSVMLIPEGAVIRDGDDAIVFAVAGGIAERRAVALGGSSNGRREVIAGLREAERVVVDPPAELNSGDRVREKTK